MQRSRTGWAAQKQLALLWNTMAPTVPAHDSKDNVASAHKLRKPIVEKLRRDRINSSIEQLKSLLGPEFVRQQPDSKQEKADILEMTVAYLRQRQRVPAGPTAHSIGTSSDGYSRCIQEAVSFLSHCELQTQAHKLLLKHFQGRAIPGSPTVTAPGSPKHHAHKKMPWQSNGLWRPW